MLLKDIQIIEPLRLEPVDTEFWVTACPYAVDFITDEGIYSASMDIGWYTDLRSGSFLINPLIPKWGNAKYTASILFHDMCFSGWLSFKVSNEFLYQGMILSGNVSETKAGAARWVLNSFGRSHYFDMDEPLKAPYQNNRSLEHLLIKDYHK